MNAFILTPPILAKPNIAVSLIQVGDMPAPESLIVSLGNWSTVDLFAHWGFEIGSLLELKRNRCCLVSGLTVLNGTQVPTEWWRMYAADSVVKVHCQVLNTLELGDLSAWNSSENWWKNIPDYRRFFADGDGKCEISEWEVSIDSLTCWHRQYDILRRRIRSVHDELSD